MKLNLKFFASLQFWLGLALAAGAVAGFLLLGQALNPAPLRIVVAAQDLQRGDTLTQEVLRVSKQQLSASLASHYLQEDDLPAALGAVVVETSTAETRWPRCAWRRGRRSRTPGGSPPRWKTPAR